MIGYQAEAWKSLSLWPSRRESSAGMPWWVELWPDCLWNKGRKDRECIDRVRECVDRSESKRIC